jgi:hypothetical protein
MKCRGIVVLVISLAALAAGGTASNSASLPRPAGFRPASGWIVARGGTSNPLLVVAVTASDVAAVRPVALFGSFKKLSRPGILVWAETVGRNRPSFPSRVVWPPRLASFRTDHGWEGQPAPNVEQRTWVGAVHGWDLDVRVFFATQHPTASLLARAQAEIDRLTLPA